MPVKIRPNGLRAVAAERSTAEDFIVGCGGLRVELPNGVVIHVSAEKPSVAAAGVAAPPAIERSTSAPQDSILGDNGPANNITASPSAHTATQHQRLPSLPPEQSAASFVGVRRGQRSPPSQGSRELPAPPSRHQRTTPSDTLCASRPTGRRVLPGTWVRPTLTSKTASLLLEKCAQFSLELTGQAL